MQRLGQDIRYGVRMLRKNPGFTAIALVTLAIGIGANTIMFSIVNVLLLRPTQVKDPDRLALCSFRNTYGYFPYSVYVDLRDHSPAFQDLMAFNRRPAILTVVSGDAARRAYAMFVSANYFPVLGVSLAYGRGFLREEERYGAEPVVVLSHRTWQQLGAHADIVGTYIAINGTLFRIVGVAPKRFTGTAVIGPDLWLPLGCYGLVAHLGQSKPQALSSEFWNYPNEVTLVGRLQPGLTMLAAQTRLRPLAARLKENYPRWWRDNSLLSLDRLPRLVPDSHANGQERTYLSGTSLFLMGISAVVLLIACLNLANMATIRGAARHREIAVRMAVGGDRLQIIRQLIIESLLLAILGGTLGLILAFWGTRSLNAWVGALKLPVDFAGSLKTSLDLRVLAATFGFCLIAAVLSGLTPALRLSRREVVADLRVSPGDVSRPTGTAHRPHGLSVVCQIALSVVLVMGASLFTRSALQASRTNSSFNLDGKLLIELDPLAAGYDLAHSQQVYETLRGHLKSLPGVQAVGLSASFPFGAGGGLGGWVREYVPGIEKSEGDERDLLTDPSARTDTVYTVGPDCFEALGIPFLQGRAFHRLDSTPEAEKVLIIDERIARRLRPDGNALGCLVQYGGPPSSPVYRVVGIVPHLPTISDDKASRGQAYVPLGPDRLPVHLHLRAVGTTRENEAALRKWISTAIRRLDPRLPILAVTTLTECRRNDPSMWSASMGAWLAATFGAMALFLASLGIYAIKGYMVASRTSEIGIRKALGATHRDILGMVLREGMVLTLTGLVVGLLLGLAAARLIRSLLYDVSPVDPVSMVVTAVLLGAVSLFASYIPARRAAKVDPMVALRSE